MSTSPRYVIDLNETDPLSLGELRGGGGKFGKIRKNEVFLIYKQVIKSYEI